MPLPLLECATHFVRSLAALWGELLICPVVTEGNLVQIVLLIAKVNEPQAGTINTTALNFVQKMMTTQDVLSAKPAKSARDQ
jgi:hypothetical protein